jgi:hypothetical protein
VGQIRPNTPVWRPNPWMKSCWTTQNGPRLDRVVRTARATARPAVVLRQRRCSGSGVLSTGGARGVSWARRGGAESPKWWRLSDMAYGSSARQGWTVVRVSRWSAMCHAARGESEEARVAANCGGEGLGNGLTGERRMVVPSGRFRRREQLWPLVAWTNGVGESKERWWCARAWMRGSRERQQRRRAMAAVDSF